MALLKGMMRLLPAVGLSFIVSVQALRAADAPTENQVQAVFLYNFSRFVEWPAQAFAQPNDPFVIGILGSDPFGACQYEAVQARAKGVAAQNADDKWVIRLGSDPFGA